MSGGVDGAEVVDLGVGLGGAADAGDDADGDGTGLGVVVVGVVVVGVVVGVEVGVVVGPGAAALGVKRCGERPGTGSAGTVPQATSPSTRDRAAAAPPTRRDARARTFPTPVTGRIIAHERPPRSRSAQRPACQDGEAHVTGRGHRPPR